MPIETFNISLESTLNKQQYGSKITCTGGKSNGKLKFNFFFKLGFGGARPLVPHLSTYFAVNSMCFVMHIHLLLTMCRRRHYVCPTKTIHAYYCVIVHGFIPLVVGVNRFCDKCSQFLVLFLQSSSSTSSSASSPHKVEELVWKWGFYEVVHRCKQHCQVNNIPTPVNNAL